MKLSIGKAWQEASAFLGREARLVAPVALATFALPTILAVGLSARNHRKGRGWLMAGVMVVWSVRDHRPDGQWLAGRSAKQWSRR